MFIISVLFYALEGFMGSSFLTAINVGLALYSVILFFKLLIQFGLPNHPLRFTMYMVSLCAAAFFSMRAMTDLSFLPPIYFMKWYPLPLVAGSLAFLLQVISTTGQLSFLQQKIISRFPLIAGLVVFAFFPQYTEYFFATCLVLSGIFFSVSVGKARYQKRLFFKMMLFLSLATLFSSLAYFWPYIVGQALLLPVLFYFFIFQKTFGITAMIEGFRADNSGVSV